MLLSDVRCQSGSALPVLNEIGASVTQVERGSVLADETGGTMREVLGAIQQVSERLGEISTTSKEQSSGVSQVGEALMQIDHTTQQNARLVEETATAAGRFASITYKIVCV